MDGWISFWFGDLLKVSSSRLLGCWKEGPLVNQNEKRRVLGLVL
jgi:hypothetical protein